MKLSLHDECKSYFRSKKNIALSCKLSSATSFPGSFILRPPGASEERETLGTRLYQVMLNFCSKGRSRLRFGKQLRFFRALGTS